MSRTLQEKIRWQLRGMVVFLILVALIGGITLYRLLNAVGNEAVAGTQIFVALDEDENVAEIAFQREVQEWKDLLLRGSDTLLYQKYYAALHAQHELAEKHLNLLVEKMNRQGIDASAVARVQRSHLALLNRYEAALQQYPLAKNPANYMRIDLLVRGADRGLGAEMESLRVAIQQQVLRADETVNNKVLNRHFLELYFVLGIMVVLFPLASIVGFAAIGRMTRRMQEEREQFHVMLNSIGDGVVVTGLDGKVEYINPVAEKMTGWPLDEARGKPLPDIFNIINEYTREPVRNPVDTVLSEGHVIALTNHTVLISRAGKECPIEDSAAPLRDKNGKLRGVVLVFHDDTLQRRAQQHLIESEERLRMTLQYAPDAVFICEQDGSIAYANSHAQNLLGYSHDEFAAMTVFDLVPADWRAAYAEGSQKILTDDQRHVFEIRLLKKDGSKIPMELNAVLLPTGRVYGSCRDITDRKSAEAEVLRSRKELDAERLLFKAIFDSAPIGIWMLGLDGKIKFINRTFCAAVGVTEQQFKDAEHYSAVLPSNITANCMRSDRECLAQDAPHLSMELLPCVDGKDHLLEITKVKLLDHESNVMGLIGLALDVTELKRTDTLLGGQKKILEMIASGMPLDNTLDEIVRFIESQSVGMVGSILLMEADGIHMKHGAAPSLPESYVAAINGAPIGPNAGSCGTAAYRKEPVYVEDIATDPLWADYKQVALPHGLRACWSTPIFDLQQRVIGTFAMYYRQPGLPQPEHLQLISTATQTASIAIARKLAERALRNSEERLSMTLRYAADAVFIFKPDGHILYANENLLNALGYTSVELIGTNCFDLAPSDWREVYQQRVGDIVSDNQHHIFEIRMLKKGGGKIPMELNVVVLPDGSIYGSCRDITERKLAKLKEQKRLDELEAIYLLSEAVSSVKSLEQVYEEAMYFMLRLLKADRAAIKLFDKDGVIHFKAWRGLPDSYRRAMDNHTFWAQDESDPQPYFVEDINDVELSGLSHAALAAGIAAYAFIPLLQHGRLLGSFEVYFNAPHRFAENEPQLALTIASHVAYAIDRKLVEQQFTDIFEFAPDAIVMTDMNAIIKLVNRQAENLFGYSSSELVGQGIDILIPQDRLDERRDLRQRFLASAVRPRPLGMTQRKDLRGITKYGRIFPVEISLSPMESTGGMMIAAAVRDVSAQRLAMEQLRDTAKELEQASALVEEERAHLADRVMERTAQLLFANKAKDSFLATMSHEIRTPLGGLLGMMELLGLSQLDQEQSEMLHVAQNSGKSLLRIVDDILDWSKIEAGKLELVPRVVSVGEMLKSVTNTYSHVASAKGIALYHRVDERLAVAHLFDELRLSQILNNFTSNAIKFTEHGSVEICAELMGQHEGNETVRFSVKDSGIGISAEQQSRLFQHYEQASTDTTRMYGGTGLGLAICRRLAELMEGSIRLESTPGAGSTFFFTVNLPLANQAAQKELQDKLANRNSPERVPDTSTLFAEGRQISVMVVDDHPVNRLLLKQQLEQLGLFVDAAESGVVGLSLWWTGHYDLIITDCHMPEIDGYELTRSIREIEQHDNRVRIPIIAWTANALAEEQGQCHAAGMDDLLTKPTELAELRKMLLKWLHKPALPVVVESAQAQQDNALKRAAFDFDVLNKFANSQHLQMEMLKEFKQHNRSDIANLKAALKDGRPDTVAHYAHRVKGTCRMVGAVELEAVCVRVEQAAKQGDMPGAQAASRSLDEVVERIEAAVAAFVGG